MKKLVIFDMDGTLADTSPGILSSHIHTLKSMGCDVPDMDKLHTLIGGPLLGTYKNVFKLSDEDARTAVRIYREYYSIHGVHQANVYPGIPELLRNLKAAGCLLMVATLKAERFARPMLAELNIAQYFDFIFGVDENDTKTKADLLKQCISVSKLSVADTVLVGDSAFDIEGAREVGIGFIGVTYGFGLRETEEQVDFILCKTPLAVLNEILKGK